MNKKSLIICLSVLVVLVVLVTIAVSFLYSGKSIAWKKGADKTEISAISNFKLLPAVPSDASAVMAFPTLADGIEMLTDSTKTFGDFIENEGDGNFISFVSTLSGLLSKNTFPSLRGQQMLVSMHYNGDLIPLLIIGAANPASDSLEVAKLISVADSAHLHSMYVDCTVSADPKSALYNTKLILVSPSETVVNSSKRHITSNHSILDNVSFSKIAASVNGDDVMFLSNDNSDKLFSRFFDPAYSKYVNFFKHISDWTAFVITDSSKKALRMEGTALSAPDPSYFLNVFRDVDGSQPQVQDVLPASTVFAVSMPMANVGKYIDAYKKYLDASSQMDHFKNVSADLESKAGMSPEKWASMTGIKEIALVTFRDKKNLRNVLLIKGSKHNDLPLAHNKYVGFADVVFGQLFSLKDESSYAESYGWEIVGSQVDVNAFISLSSPKTRLMSLLNDADIYSDCNVRNCTLFSYFSLTEFPPILSKVFSSYMAPGFARTLEGISYSPAVLAITKESNELKINLNVSRVEVTKTVVQEVDSRVIVPKGPFKVKNTGDNKMYTLAQQDNNYLTLSDDKGKGIWGVPFSGKICGAVASIDYYASNKYQFLFASGSKLYLLDKLGRFVNPFPVDLGKEILVGPDSYDCSGSHGYTAVVLHKDNTIGMYDLHGKTPAAWKGITSKETIKGLPELLKVNNKKYWAVRTSVQTLIFDFNGGQPLSTWTGGKMIRPDTKIEIQGTSLNVMCYDGKQRNFKLK